MAHPRCLEPLLLDELERRWRAVSAPIIEQLIPGIPAERMNELTSSLGVTLPSELRTWWGWHDVDEGGTAGTRDMTGTGWEFMRLEEAVAEANWRRHLDAVEREAWTPPDGRRYPPLWRDAWLPIASVGHSGLAVVDCSDPEQAASPIYYVEWPGTDASSPPRARSFAEMIGWWIEAFDDGAYGHDRTTGRLTHEHERLDPQRELTRLI